MDHTETDYAEDFEIELNNLINLYINKGLKPEAIEEIMLDCIEDCYMFSLENE
jgi:hypothetical protein